MCIFCFFLRNILFLQILCFPTWGYVAEVFNYKSTLNLVFDGSNISHHLLDTKGFEQWDSRDAFGLAWCESWAQVTRITGQCHCWGTPEPLIKKQSWHSLRLSVILEHWWRGRDFCLTGLVRWHFVVFCYICELITLFFNSKTLVNSHTNY